jgi:hypothetical protein
MKQMLKMLQMTTIIALRQGKKQLAAEGGGCHALRRGYFWRRVFDAGRVSCCTGFSLLLAGVAGAGACRWQC